MVVHDLAVSLTKQLIQTNTVNPPGNEKDCVRLLAPLLVQAGFQVQEYEYGAERSSLVARLNPEAGPAIVLSGHLDTVPLGSQVWMHEPFSAVVEDEKIFGRGSADMKSGVAVLVAAAIHHAASGKQIPLTLALSANEEVGCGGAEQLLQEKALPAAKCVLVAEPTGNIPCLGHKGVYWLKVLFHGKTAHAAFPQLGDNALVKAAQAVIALNNDLSLGTVHDVMGRATLVTSRLFSGDNYNSVPDRAELGIDARTTVTMPNTHLATAVYNLLAAYEVETEVIFNLPPLWTDPGDPLVQQVFSSCERIQSIRHTPRIATFYTDGGVLGPGLDNAPTIILGPGESGMAHQVDEYVSLAQIHESVDMYLEILNHLGTASR